MSQQARHSISQGNYISTDPETSGFDLSSGAKWIYPENYPRRDYQFSIVQTALYNNTLVCLPTGLGKTFIAAVVMYNFWRWYPRGRVVFLAPTKPLVAQQINACHEIMGIPSDETIELTGAINQTKRAIAWAHKRVIFATPQTFQKDLQNNYVPYELIKCIVIDEAHKALGKHSYCEIVRMVNEKNKFFRVLALSATPGSKIDHVREVIQNLLISELELRDDTSPDITPYTNDRSMEKIIVQLDKDLNDFKERYISIMDPHVRILIKNHILQGSAANMYKGRIFMLMKQYESRPNKAQNHGAIMKTLNILLTMSHAYELLLKHGLRAFYHFYLNHSDKFWLDAEVELKLMLEEIKLYIGDFPVIQPSSLESIPDIPDNLIFGHSKFKKLQDLLVEHFTSFSMQNKSTRAIVFVEYRDIVNEVYVLLLQKRPLIRPQMFVGQAGQKQKQQLAALEDFRNNKVNVLISTSVGEEGLDVGEVDLIVCFDISTSTPTRLVQRMGRTGRKRSGRVVLLLTEGKEVQTLNQAMSKKDSLNNKVLQSSNIASSLYQSSPRMVPQSVTPECLAMFIKAIPKTPKTKGKKVPATKVAKPPAEKKPRKRKKDAAFEEDDDCMIMPSTSTSPIKPSQAKSPSKSKLTKDTNNQRSNQPSMMKFLMDQRQSKKSLFSHETDSGFSEEFQLPQIRDNTYSFIRPHEVKLLTSDSHALEFLTLCAMKKSEESSTRNTLDLDLNWIPPRSPMSEESSEEVLRDLVIPSVESLECIKNLRLCETPHTRDEEDTYFPDSIQVSRPCSYDEFSRKDEGIENDFFENFGEVESKYVTGRRSNAVQKCDLDDNIEISATDFFCTFDEDKRKSSVLSRQPSPKNLEEIEVSATDFFSTFTEDKPVNSTIKQDEKDSQRSSIIAPANVEVDFENLLDEYTESETSETPSLLPEGENIFDDLLEGGSSADEDLFAEENVTVVPKLNETIRAKRSASMSPKRDSPPKKPKFSHAASDSSDNDSAVMGTPPKPSKSVPSSLVSPVKEMEEVDSEEDIFDGLDGDETQFDGAFDAEENKNVTLVAELEREMNTSPVFTKEEKNVTLIRDDDFERKMSVSPVFSIEDKNKTLVDDQKVNREMNKSPVLTIENRIRVSQGESKKETCVVELDANDWEDDFDFAPVLQVEKEKVSSFFQSKASSSTGWISPGQSLPPAKKKNLCLKNWNKKPDDEHKILTALTKPRLQLSSLKETTSKDKDGFAMPIIPKSNKENKLPVWRERLKTTPSKGGISPRFRKYHSESDLRSSAEKARKKVKRRQRPKARKRIASDFIDEEAEVSSDCDTSEGSSGDENHDHEMNSFVSYTQDFSEAVDMKAHYLQTINKSPIRAGAFMIKEVRRKVPDIEVFSQPVSHEEMNESYLHDSFCVGEESQMNGLESEPEESILEQIESSLESRRRKMREKREKKRSKFKCLQKNKKESRNEQNDSSEDETEILRRQIMEESMMLKR